MPISDNFIDHKEDSSLLNADFNILKFSKTIEKHRIVWAICKHIDFFDFFKINTYQFGEFLGCLQKKYDKRNNSFHNYDHGIAGFI